MTTPICGNIFKFKRQWREGRMCFELLRSKRCARVKEMHKEAINGGECVTEGGMKILHVPSNCEYFVCSST